MWNHQLGPWWLICQPISIHLSWLCPVIANVPACGPKVLSTKSRLGWGPLEPITPDNDTKASKVTSGSFSSLATWTSAVDTWTLGQSSVMAEWQHPSLPEHSVGSWAEGTPVPTSRGSRSGDGCSRHTPLPDQEALSGALSRTGRGLRWKFRHCHRSRG